MAYKIIAGMTQQFYHTIPSGLDMIVTSPTREGIFKNLAQIHFNKFPEFIADILTKIEGHTIIDITDGQGDEKQDILSLTRSGVRCLTQCKHTSNYNSHYNGDEIDIMVSACLRKNCREAIFVTNSDLTPQGKKYITDEEYNRGISNKKDHRKIDYWNGLKLWDKIKNNQDIINKWFGNLGQVHGLRNFKFDLTVQKMPYSKNDSIIQHEAFSEIVKKIKEVSWIKEIEDDNLFIADISPNYEVTLRKWFQFTGELDINFIPPDDDVNFINKALYALTIEVKVKYDQQFSPMILRDEIVKKICDEVLHDQQEYDGWWYILTSQIQSFIYLHDVGEPREINLTSSEAFVKTNTASTEKEIIFCTELGSKFKTVQNEDDSIQLHKTTLTNVVILFEQKIHPVQQYNHQIMQYAQLDRIKTFNFYAIQGIDTAMMMRIRRLLHYEWFVFQHNDDALIWAEDPSTEQEIIESVYNKIAAVGLTKLNVRETDIPLILDNIRNDIAPATWMYTSEISSLSTPMLLDRRIFMLSKVIKSKKINLKLQMKLLEFKFYYEHQFGYESLKEGTHRMNSKEIKGLLFDLFTIRGTRMLDIAFNDNEVAIYVRFNDGKTQSSAILSSNYLKEYKAIYDRIKKVIC